MEIIKTVAEMKALSKQWRDEGLSIGLVPTMGALHDGHLSLMARARKENDRVVASVFVNPLQFAPDEDYDNYPRDLEGDAAKAATQNIDAIFAPEVDDMYPPYFNSFVTVEGLTDTMEGVTRPTHFRGVCTVVNKLFNICDPDNAYFGQKDIQQLAIISRFATDLNMRVKVNGCPIVREEDGLAKSSRNVYLNPEERQAALCLSRSLKRGKEVIEGGERDAAKVKQAVVEVLEAEPMADIDYVEVADFNTMQYSDTISDATVLAIAVRIGTTRLIDNYLCDLRD